MATADATKLRRGIIVVLLFLLFILALLPAALLSYVRSVARTDTAYQALVNYAQASHGNASAKAWLVAHPTHFRITNLGPNNSVVATKDAKGGCWTLYVSSGASANPLLGAASYCR
jgi:hypothetical protein